MPADAVAIGEVGLAGDLRRVTRHGSQAGRGGAAGLQLRRWCRAGVTAVPAGLRTIPADNIGRRRCECCGKSRQTDAGRS